MSEKGANGLASCEYLAERQRPGEIGGLWCFRPIIGDYDKEEYFCWNAVLDGPGSY